MFFSYYFAYVSPSVLHGAMSLATPPLCNASWGKTQWSGIHSLWRWWDILKSEWVLSHCVLPRDAGTGSPRWFHPPSNPLCWIWVSVILSWQSGPLFGFSWWILCKIWSGGYVWTKIKVGLTCDLMWVHMGLCSFQWGEQLYMVGCSKPLMSE